MQTLASTFDAEWGGFGGAPKFPPTMSLDLLLLWFLRTGDEGARNIVTVSLDAMTVLRDEMQLPPNVSDSIKDLAEKITKNARTPFDRAAIRAHAERFSRQRFADEMTALIS